MKHIHLIGIGGAGLSAIAQVLLDKGYTVSGSDRVASALFNVITNAGARTYLSHAAEQIKGADIVLRSSAIPDDNPEVLAALAQGIPVLKRAEFLGELTDGKQTIAIAGSHGKTTTTAMLVWMLSKLNQDPSYIVGGVINQFACNAHAGTGQYFVIEADEYDNMFLGLSPTIGIVTNIEYDHPDFFPTEKYYMDAFLAFVERIQPNGLALLCMDDPLTQKLMDVITKSGIRVLSYGASPQADYQADHIQLDGVQHRFCLKKRDEVGRILELGSQMLTLPGQHNILNATAALAVIDQLGLPLDKAMSALQSFTGT
jgi:UDP-N-acetylmuramate--alanine ligase